MVDLLCVCSKTISMLLFFFFNDTATTEIYTLSLHDALPICPQIRCSRPALHGRLPLEGPLSSVLPKSLRSDRTNELRTDRKSTRLNSSHANISYAVFCLKKKKTPLHSHQYQYVLAA